MSTPIHDLTQYDHYPPLEAVVAAWVRPGPQPAWHAAMRTNVENDMPLLARALDRLAEEHQ